MSREEFKAITAKIAEQERQRAAAQEEALRNRLRAEKEQIQAAAKAEVAKAKLDAAAAAVLARKVADDRVAAVQAEATKAAQVAAAKKIAAAEAARKAAVDSLASNKANAEALMTDRLRAQRETLEAAKLEAVNLEKAKTFADRQKMEEKLASLQRQLQAKTAGELGEGAEIDLYETLRTEFRNDRFTRVKKGSAGADIVHEIIQGARVAGRIVYDSKNRDAWRNDYATKLRADQLAAKADYGILASRVFPAGAHQIHLQDGVIVANPARVIDLVQLLRRQVLTLDGLRLAGQARADKASRVYEYIVSDRCAQLFEEIDTLTDDLLAIDVKEVKAHESTWRQRGQLLKSIQRARGSLIGEIDQITDASIEQALA